MTKREKTDTKKNFTVVIYRTAHKTLLTGWATNVLLKQAVRQARGRIRPKNQHH